MARTVVNGTTGADTYIAPVATDNYVAYGYAGNDTMTGGDLYDQLFGGSGNDSADGGAGNDRIYGDTGNDTLIGGAGNDSLSGGAGNDTLSYASDTAGVTVNLSTQIMSGGNSGTDLISSFENVIGGSGNDNLTANGSGSSLEGGAGDDVLISGAGVDTLVAGDGNDTYYVDSAFDVVTETATTLSNDTINSTADITLVTNVENLTLTGSAVSGTGNDLDNNITGNSANNALSGGINGNDTLAGGLGDDQLYGNTGNDELSGDVGLDMLIGGAGDDTLTGGAGNDTFMFASSGNNGKDTITDFISGTDQLDLMATLSGTANLVLNISNGTALGAIALGSDSVNVVTTTDGLGASFTTGGTHDLSSADTTTGAVSATLAAFFAEHWGTSTTMDTDVGVFILNISTTNAYVYQWVNNTTADVIQATELSLIGVLTGTVADTDIIV